MINSYCSKKLIQYQKYVLITKKLQINNMSIICPQILHHLPWLVNWVWTNLVVRSHISESLVVIFPHWVSTWVSPSWWIPCGFEFFLLYHHCITKRLMIMDGMLCWPILSLGCLISPWVFDQCTLNCSLSFNLLS